MESSLNTIRNFISELKSFTFWDRLFRWNRIKTLLIDVNAELQRLLNEQETINRLSHELEIQKNKNKSLEDVQVDVRVLRQEKETWVKEKTTLENTNNDYLKRGKEVSQELLIAKQKVDALEAELKKISEENTRFKANAEQKQDDFDKSIANLNKLREDILREDREKKEKAQQNEIDRINKLKETWSNHELAVQQRIKIICNKHGVEYVDKVPFKGKPDNTLKINGEFVIFDAKSPSGEDLSNFPTYIRSQAENASKYVKEEDVRREIFLVIPTNTLDILDQYEFRLSDYTVYLISIDSLEPIILALRRIEDYEFAEQLSPEERENICRVIGKFVHLSKRRIQIDGFFAKQFFELVYRSEADLPKDILEKVVGFEMAEKLNPPIERRAKIISVKELESDTNKLKGEANLKGIVTEDSLLSQGINKLPLYSTESERKDQNQSKLFDS